jgi:hypothetical protein
VITLLKVHIKIKIRKEILKEKLLLLVLKRNLNLLDEHCMNQELLEMHKCNEVEELIFSLKNIYDEIIQKFMMTLKRE